MSGFAIICASETQPDPVWHGQGTIGSEITAPKTPWPLQDAISSKGT
jgi:hypothetical protein